jgi:hypothetical protein
VRDLDKALGQERTRLFETFECREDGPKLDREALWTRLDGILKGLVRRVSLRYGAEIPVTLQIREFARRLQRNKNMYQFLHEDMFAGLTTERRPWLRLDDDCEPKTMLEGLYLDDARLRRDEFHAAPRKKALVTLDITMRHAKERGLVFVRYRRLAAAIATLLRKHGRLVILVDGTGTGRDRYAKLERFSRTPGAVLLIVRNTGRRGLDIPAAEYAILYSPKAEEYVVWQELSRIRSTVAATKPTYILYYGRTSEETRCRNLQTAMAASHHRYKFVWTDGKSRESPEHDVEAR